MRGGGKKEDGGERGKKRGGGEQRSPRVSSGPKSSVTDVQRYRNESDYKGWKSQSSNLSTGPYGDCLFP